MIANSLFLTGKTIITIICYIFRYVMENTTITKIKLPKKLGLDLCYIAAIFLAYNIISDKPPSRLHIYTEKIANNYPPLESNIVCFVVVALFLIIWKIAIFIHNKSDEINIISAPDNVLVKKVIFYTSTFIIGFIMFCFAVQTQ